MDNEILTRQDGTPITKPERAAFASGVDYLRAFHAYKDEIAKVANEAFNAEWQKRMAKRGRK